MRRGVPETGGRDAKGENKRIGEEFRKLESELWREGILKMKGGYVDEKSKLQRGS